MNEPIYSYMKLGTIAFMSYPEIMKGEGPMLETIKKLAGDPYFTAIECSWIKDPSVRAKAVELLKESGLTVCYGAQPRFLTTGLNINGLNEEGRLKALESLKEGLYEARELGAKGIAFLSGRYEEETKERSYAALVKSTREICRLAREMDMRVELEVFDYDVDKKSLIGPTLYAKRFAEEIRREYDNFGLLIDLSHFPLIHEGIEESILPVKDLITHVHIGNAVIDPALEAYGDAHPRFGFPGSANGQAELVQFLRTLLDVGFLNREDPPVLSVEVKPWKDEDPDVVLASCKRFMDEAWRLV